MSYIKNARLANMATLSSDDQAKQIFERRKDETLFGINPYTANESAIYRALPGEDRSYFQAFSTADSPEKRQRILELVPRNQRELYIARWKLEQTQDMRAARDNMINESVQGSVISDRVNSTYGEAKTEGLPKTPELYEMFLSSKYPKENYPDWYRRTQLLPDVPLPGADWVGWHPSVDLEDIKLKMVAESGQNIHDYGFYNTQLRELGGKPFLDKATQELIAARSNNSFHTRRLLGGIFAEKNMHYEIGISKEWGPGSSPSFSVELEQ